MKPKKISGVPAQQRGGFHDTESLKISTVRKKPQKNSIC